MIERRAIYRISDGIVINIWEDFDTNNPEHRDWTPADAYDLGPESGTVQPGDTWDGSIYVPAPIEPPPKIDTEPGPVDVVKEFIRLGVKKADGSALTKEDFSQEFQDRLP